MGHTYQVSGQSNNRRLTTALLNGLPRVEMILMTFYMDLVAILTTWFFASQISQCGINHTLNYLPKFDKGGIQHQNCDAWQLLVEPALSGRLRSDHPKKDQHFS
jgi:hypothetical protein